MTKYTILIPLDGSDFSRQVIPAVRRFFPPEQCQLILLRCADLPEGMIAAPPRPLLEGWSISEYASAREAERACHAIYSTQVEQNRRDALELALAVEQRALQAQGYTVTTIVRFGEPAQEIASVAATMGIDIVAMASHGRRGVSKMIMGSVAEHVLHNLPMPLLLVRPQEHPRPQAAELRIIVPLDGSSFAEQALEQAQQIAAAADATLVLVAAAPLQDDIGLASVGAAPHWVIAGEQEQRERLRHYLEHMHARLVAAGLKAIAILSLEHPERAIVEAGEQEQAGLIVMASHGRSGMARMLLGSVANRVLHSSDLPVLLVRQQPLAEQRVDEEELRAAY